MKDNCGELRDPIQLLAPISSQDAQGNTVRRWQVVAETKAQARDLSGREFFAAAQHQMENIMNFKIRWRSGLSCGMRLRYQGALYDVLQVNHLNNRRGGYMLLRARLVQAEEETYGNI